MEESCSEEGRGDIGQVSSERGGHPKARRETALRTEGGATRLVKSATAPSSSTNGPRWSVGQLSATAPKIQICVPSCSVGHASVTVPRHQKTFLIRK